MTGFLHPVRRLASRRGRRGVFAALAAAVLAGLTLGVSNEATSPERWSARTIHPGSGALSPAKLARSPVTWNGGQMTTAGGEQVSVYVSAALPPELGTAQTWADFLGGLVHGSELSALEAYIATFAETQGICGEDALGCYAGNRMVSMGETMFDVTAAEVVRHEYGHHVAFHRLNPPWAAIDWGPNHWASAQNVCARAAAGTVSPGDEGSRYRLNPGEGWAETFRVLDERRAGITSSGWEIVDPSFFPDDRALEAAEQDVLQPWTAGRTTTYRTRFTAKSKRVWTIRLATPLDGAAEITVSLPRGALHDVALVDSARKRTLAKGLWAGATVKTIVTNVCGQRSLSLRVTQKGAFGRVRVVAKLP